MRKNDLVGMLGKAVLIVGLPVILTTALLHQDKQKQKIIENPATFMNYTVQDKDCISSVVAQYSNVPDSVDKRDVWEYTRQINKKKTSDLQPGERLIFPVYKTQR